MSKTEPSSINSPFCMTATRLAMSLTICIFVGNQDHCQAQTSDSALAEEQGFVWSFLDLGRMLIRQKSKSLDRWRAHAQSPPVVFVHLTIEQDSCPPDLTDQLVPTTWLLFQPFALRQI